MTAKERLKKFVESKHLGRNKFEEKVGISLGYLSSKSPSLGTDIIEKIVRVYPDLNIDWLITGEGEITRSTIEKEKNIKIKYAPLITRYAQSLYSLHMNEESYIKTLAVVPILDDGNDPRDFFAFEMRGESMNDGSINSFKSGDILICREVEPKFWSGQLNSCKGKTLVIVHKTEGILIKQIVDYRPNSTLTIHSINPVFPDMEIDFNDICKLFSIVKIFRDKF